MGYYDGLAGGNIIRRKNGCEGQYEASYYRPNSQCSKRSAHKMGHWSKIEGSEYPSAMVRLYTTLATHEVLNIGHNFRPQKARNMYPKKKKKAEDEPHLIC